MKREQKDEGVSSSTTRKRAGSNPLIISSILKSSPGEPREYSMPAGGRGYTRPASLVSLWSTAPFLLNNMVGDFNLSPSVKDRMQSFDDSIEKMLWPEKRDGRGAGSI